MLHSLFVKKKKFNYIVFRLKDENNHIVLYTKKYKNKFNSSEQNLDNKNYFIIIQWHLIIEYF